MLSGALLNEMSEKKIGRKKEARALSDFPTFSSAMAKSFSHPLEVQSEAWKLHDAGGNAEKGNCCFSEWDFGAASCNVVEEFFQMKLVCFSFFPQIDIGLFE